MQATPFRMTAAGRTLSDEEVVKLSENEARALLARARRPDGKPICGKCSSPRCSPRARPGYYRCLDCKTDFSGTTGTTLQSHKLPLRRIFAAIFYLVVLPYGVSSASLSVLMALTRIYTDDLNSYDFLHAFFKVQRVNHSVHYVNGSAHTNGAESFHGRLRKAQSLYGRFVPGDDFMLYIYEMAFKHAAGGMDTRSLWESVIRLIASQPISERFCNYWQGIRSMAA
jgi:transposase-like protein